LLSLFPFFCIRQRSRDQRNRNQRRRWGTLGQNPRRTHWNYLSVSTGPDGSFHLIGISPGSYTLEVSGLGYRTERIAFQIATSQDIREFQVSIAPDHFKTSDSIQVTADVFESTDWPAPGDLTLTASEMRETSTVLANDPFRSVQTLPGVSASGNNDFLAQFNVLGVPYQDVGIYVDDVLVPNLLHAIPSFQDTPTLSLLTSNDVEDIHLMPVAYPMRYADGAGAALAIRTRSGAEDAMHFHASIGIADTELLGEGNFGQSHKGTWLVGYRKSYFGYLEHALADSRFSDDGFYDVDVKFTFKLTENQTLSMLGTGGRVSINDPSLVSNPGSVDLKTGTSDLAITRFGWRWTPNSSLLFDARFAYLYSSFRQTNSANQSLGDSLEREWNSGFTLAWSWRRASVFQAGYSLRKPTLAQTSVIFPSTTPFPTSFHSTEYRHDGFAQNSLELLHGRMRLQGGIRWSQLESLRTEPLSGNLAASIDPTRAIRLDVSCGHYAQLPLTGRITIGEVSGASFIGLSSLPRTSWQCLAGVEHRFGERTRIRAEIFDRENENRFDLFAFPVPFQKPTPLARDVLLSRDYSRGLQLLFQRRSENRLSGWLGYALVHAKSRNYSTPLPSPVNNVFGVDTSYLPTPTDQRHNISLFATYRLASSVRVSVKNLYGSGYPAFTFFTSTLRLPSYERLDLRADKSWAYPKWKLSLYGELLNATNHNNRRFVDIEFGPTTNQPVLFTDQLLPITPTAGLVFDF
jgi:hypothetical protein